MNWTPKELELLGNEKLSLEEVCKRTGRTFQAAKTRRKQLRREIKAGLPTQPEASTPTVAYLTKELRQLRRDLAKAQEGQAAVDLLCQQVHELAPKAYDPPPFIWEPTRKAIKSSPQSAVLLFSDTHIGARVKPDETLGLGQYNFELFLRRLCRLEKSVASIIKDHTLAEVSEIVIPMLGDMLDGALVHSAECAQSVTLMQQFYSGGHAIAQFLRNLSVLAPIRIYTTVGNHTRWQNQKRMPTKNRYSNLDMFLYAYVQALTRDLDRIQWTLDTQPFATFDVQGFPFYCGHGDDLRGGDKILGLPSHSMGRMVSTTTQLFSRAKRDIPAYYCLGHLHRPISVPHANGEIIVNGAFPGIDGFALHNYFNSSRPMQRLFFMHPRYGQSAHYPLQLDTGDEKPHHYKLPEIFLAE